MTFTTLAAAKTFLAHHTYCVGLPKTAKSSNTSDK